MRDALATLPWVEYRTIDANGSTRQVRFGINDRSKFSLEEINNALPSRYRRGLRVVEGPS